MDRREECAGDGGNQVEDFKKEIQGTQRESNCHYCGSTRRRQGRGRQIDLAARLSGQLAGRGPGRGLDASCDDCQIRRAAFGGIRLGCGFEHRSTCSTSGNGFVRHCCIRSSRWKRSCCGIENSQAIQDGSAPPKRESGLSPGRQCAKFVASSYETRSQKHG